VIDGDLQDVERIVGIDLYEIDHSGVNLMKSNACSKSLPDKTLARAIHRLSDPWIDYPRGLKARKKGSKSRHDDTKLPICYAWHYACVDVAIHALRPSQTSSAVVNSQAWPR
jgi:hypothetical protein